MAEPKTVFVFFDYTKEDGRSGVCVLQIIGRPGWGFQDC